MTICHDNADCHYSASISYCKKIDTSSASSVNGDMAVAGECMWTWGFWVALVLILATAVFIILVCILCIRHNYCQSRRRSSLEWAQPSIRSPRDAL